MKLPKSKYFSLLVEMEIEHLKEMMSLIELYLNGVKDDIKTRKENASPEEYDSECKIRSIPVTDSDLFRSLNPEYSGHRFRFIPATFCRVPESGKAVAALDNLNGISHHVSSEKERRTRWQKRGYPCEKSEKYSG